MYAAWMLAASLGKWRYFIAGSALAVFLGLLIRTCGRVLAPLGERRVFTGKVTEAQQRSGRTALTVAFTDDRRLSHTAAFLSDEPAEAGAEIRFAIRAELFASGEYPQKLADAEKAGSDILSCRAHKSLLRRRICREMILGLLLSGIALGAVILAMKFCFPA